ncbi:hypothetical protein [Natrinema sp. DC36]|uniref:hypothetical protein n=1 Tax=Natrinema sp. DC36 TaxID=2878680 RepID=UPI001CF0BEA6|nr:hypothetical protein [Natrinema sp. DC36]
MSVEQDFSAIRTSAFSDVTASQIPSTVSCISTFPSDDLLVHLGNGIYDITRQGKQYLAGELDAWDLAAD